MNKKFVSVILIICLFLGILAGNTASFSAIAEDDNYYNIVEIVHAKEYQQLSFLDGLGDEDKLNEHQTEAMKFSETYPIFGKNGNCVSSFYTLDELTTKGLNPADYNTKNRVGVIRYDETVSNGFKLYVISENTSGLQFYGELKDGNYPELDSWEGAKYFTLTESIDDNGIAVPTEKTPIKYLYRCKKDGNDVFVIFADTKNGSWVYSPAIDGYKYRYVNDVLQNYGVVETEYYSDFINKAVEFGYSFTYQDDLSETYFQCADVEYEVLGEIENLSLSYKDLLSKIVPEGEKAKVSVYTIEDLVKKYEGKEEDLKAFVDNTDLIYFNSTKSADDWSKFYLSLTEKEATEELSDFNDVDAIPNLYKYLYNKVYKRNINVIFSETIDDLKDADTVGYYNTFYYACNAMYPNALHNIAKDKNIYANLFSDKSVTLQQIRDILPAENEALGLTYPNMGIDNYNATETLAEHNVFTFDTDNLGVNYISGTIVPYTDLTSECVTYKENEETSAKESDTTVEKALYKLINKPVKSRIKDVDLRVLELQPCNDFLSEDFWNLRLYGIDPYCTGSIKVTQMSTKEFVGYNESLTANFDMVYFGTSSSIFNSNATAQYILKQNVFFIPVDDKWHTFKASDLVYGITDETKVEITEVKIGNYKTLNTTDNNKSGYLYKTYGVQYNAPVSGEGYNDIGSNADYLKSQISNTKDTVDFMALKSALNNRASKTYLKSFGSYTNVSLKMKINGVEYSYDIKLHMSYGDRYYNGTNDDTHPKYTYSLAVPYKDSDNDYYWSYDLSGLGNFEDKTTEHNKQTVSYVKDNILYVNTHFKPTKDTILSQLSYYEQVNGYIYNQYKCNYKTKYRYRLYTYDNWTGRYSNVYDEVFLPNNNGNYYAWYNNVYCYYKYIDEEYERERGDFIGKVVLQNKQNKDGFYSYSGTDYYFEYKEKDSSLYNFITTVVKPETYNHVTDGFDTVFNDETMNGQIYMHTGDIAIVRGFYGWFPNDNTDSKQNDLTYVRTAGNDILDRQLEELYAFADSGRYVVFESLLKDKNGNLNEKAFDTTSNIYKLAKSKKSISNSSLRKADLKIIDDNSIEMVVSSIPLPYIDSNFSTDESKLNFIRKEDEVVITAKDNSDEAKSYYDSVMKNLTNGRSSYSYEELGIEATDTETAKHIADGKSLRKLFALQEPELEYTFSVVGGEKKANDTLSIELYLDTVADSIFNDYEKVDGLKVYDNETGLLIKPNQIQIGKEYTIKRELTEENYGCIHWQIRLVNETQDVTEAVKEGYSFRIVDKNNVSDVYILQVAPHSGGTYLVLANNSTNAKIKDSLNTKDYQQYLKYLESIKDLGYSLNVVTANDETIEKWANGSKNFTVPFYSEDEKGNGKTTNVKISDIDMLIIGFADYAQYVEADNDKVLPVIISDFIKEKKSILFSHDDAIYANRTLDKLYRTSMGLDRFGIAYLEEYPVLSDFQDTTSRDNYFNNKKLVNHYTKITSSKDSSGIMSHGGDGIAEFQAVAKGLGFDVDNAHGDLYGASDCYLMRCYPQWSDDYLSLPPINKAIFEDLGIPSNNLTTKEVSESSRGQINTYPFYLEGNLQTALTHHQYYQLDLNNPNMKVWYCLAGSNKSGYKHSKYYDYTHNDVRNNYYIYSNENILYTGMGHSGMGGQGDWVTNDELKLFINTMFMALRPKATSTTLTCNNANAINEKDACYVYLDYDTVTGELAESTQKDLDYNNIELNYTIENNSIALNKHNYLYFEGEDSIIKEVLKSDGVTRLDTTTIKYKDKNITVYDLGEEESCRLIVDVDKFKNINDLSDDEKFTLEIKTTAITTYGYGDDSISNTHTTYIIKRGLFNLQ